MKPIACFRRAVDREWIRVGWAGTQTLKHRLIALVPLLIFAVPALIIEPVSYGAGAVFLLTGMVLTIVASLWVEGRRLVGTGSFSSKRSERFVRRSRLSQEDAGESKPSDG